MSPLPLPVPMTDARLTASRPAAPRQTMARRPDGAVASGPLPATLLEPIGQGIASCPALWQPLAARAVEAPVVLMATEGYQVRLEAHPHGVRVEARQPGATHTLSVVTGRLRVREASGGGLVPAGATVAVPTGTDTVIENPDGSTALAVHVRSGFRWRAPLADVAS